MNACTQHRRQLALLSIQELDEREKAVALAHTNECAACRAYWQQLQSVVGLFREDAERSVEPTHVPVFVRPERKAPVFAWLTLPRAVAFAAAALVICAGPVLFHKRPPQTGGTISVASHPAPISVPTIADSRRLINEDLEALNDSAAKHRGSDFVFSVGTRYEGP